MLTPLLPTISGIGINNKTPPEQFTENIEKDNGVDQKTSHQTIVYFFIDSLLVRILEKSYL